MRKLLLLLFLAVPGHGTVLAAPADEPEKYIDWGVLAYDLNASSSARWSFSFAQLTDTHIGAGTTDYGTPGYDDLPPAADTSSSAVNLRAAVQWINRHKEEQKIKFVVITGDITDNAQKSEFLKAREILDGLAMPYAPVIGNHDVWPFSFNGAAAPAPVGDRYFKEVFGAEFSKLSAVMSGWDDGTRLSTVTGLGAERPAYLQNYAFKYGGYTFVALDFADRAGHPDAEGAAYNMALFDFPGGTLNWFKNYYAGIDTGPGHLVVFSHYPLTRQDWNGGYLFPPSAYAVIADALAARPVIGLWNSGHVHRNKIYPITNSAGAAIAPVVETASSRGELHLRIIRVWNK